MTTRRLKRASPSRASAFGTFIAGLAALSSSVAAQPVRIETASQVGHGYMVAEGGLCWVLLPRHVAGEARRATAFTPEPVLTGQVFLQTPFWEGMDLAVGRLRGEAEARCTARLSAFEGRAGVERDGAAELVRVRGSGEVVRVPMRLLRTDYLTLEAEAAGGAEVAAGDSGTVLEAGGRPVGMVVETPDTRRAVALRAEEIAMNAGRFIGRRGASLARQTDPVAAEQPGGFAVGLVNASRPPASPEQGPENLLGEGAYVARPGGALRMVFEVEGDESVPLVRVRLLADAEAARAEGHALPRDVRVEVDSSPGGGRWRPFRTGTGGPDGVTDLRRAPTLARRVAVTVTSAWSDGPVRVDGVAFE